MPAEGRSDEAHQEQRGLVAHHLRAVRPRSHLRGRQPHGVHHGFGDSRGQVRARVLHMQQRGQEEVRGVRGVHEVQQARLQQVIGI